jgi:hypothetical protein
MAVTLNASTTTGLVQSADTSGIIELQNNGTTKLTVNSSGATIPTAIVTTLSDGTNSTSATNCIKGSAKAWVNYKGTATRGINASYNVSSVTYNSTGSYTINFTNAFADANYASVGTCQTTASFAVVLKLATTGQTTSASNIITAYQSGGTGQDLVVDSDLICMAFFK